MQSIGAKLCLVLFTVIAQAPAAGQTEAGDNNTAAAKAEKLERKVATAEAAVSPSATEAITEAEARAADPAGSEPLDDAFICLARTIYWETKGGDEASMQAIAGVVLNRLGHEGFPETVCEVVKQGQERGSCEFSWWCDGRSDAVEEEQPYAQAKEIARRALNGELDDRTDGALYFHHRDVDPYWSDEFIKLVDVGDHIFYKPADGRAR